MTVNPFKAFRTEQLNINPWDYFIRYDKDDSLLGDRPLVYEGGRGSGKTMYFYCNSWLPTLKVAENNNESLNDLFSKRVNVGFYHKVNDTFLKSFKGDRLDENKWLSLFDTYFNYIIIKDIICFLETLTEKNYLEKRKVLEIFDKILSEKIGIEKDEEHTFHIFRNKVDAKLDFIQSFINNDLDINRIILLTPSQLIDSLLAELHGLSEFQYTQFHILIDQFETLSTEQQVRINTLIKKSDSKIVYNIAVKTLGHKTYDTLVDGEVIQRKHDYRHFRIEQDIDEEKYPDFLKSIIKKRLEAFIAGDNVEEFTDINYYLGQYDFDDELNELSKKGDRVNTLRNEVADLIRKNQKEKEAIEDIIDSLTKCDLLNLRLHKALLLRKGLTPEIIYKNFLEYNSASNKTTTAYHNWLNPAKPNIIVLLCREFRHPKKYYGFNTFTYLSKGVIRNFLELCENAFDIAIANGFSFNEPRQLTKEEQNRAAIETSKSNLMELKQFRGYGRPLFNFIINLGNLFYAIQCNPKHTLSQLNVNHFSIKIIEKDEKVETLLRMAEKHNALLVDLATKVDKTNSPDIENYFLNYLFCPYFKIAYGKKYSISLSANEIMQLSEMEGINNRKFLNRFNLEEEIIDQGTLF